MRHAVCVATLFRLKLHVSSFFSQDVNSTNSEMNFASNKVTTTEASTKLTPLEFLVRLSIIYIMRKIKHKMGMLTFTGLIFI